MNSLCYEKPGFINYFAYIRNDYLGKFLCRYKKFSEYNSPNLFCPITYVNCLNFAFDCCSISLQNIKNTKTPSLESFPADGTHRHLPLLHLLQQLDGLYNSVSWCFNPKFYSHCDSSTGDDIS